MVGDVERKNDAQADSSADIRLNLARNVESDQIITPPLSSPSGPSQDMHIDLTSLMKGFFTDSDA